MSKSQDHGNGDLLLERKISRSGLRPAIGSRIGSFISSFREIKIKVRKFH